MEAAIYPKQLTYYSDYHKFVADAHEAVRSDDDLERVVRHAAKQIVEELYFIDDEDEVLEAIETITNEALKSLLACKTYIDDGGYVWRLEDYEEALFEKETA